MRVITAFSALIAMTLTACAPVATPESKAPTAAFKTEAAKAFVAGFAPVQVKITRNHSELKGPANCEIDSPKYSVKFTAPAEVNLPAYSNGAVPVTLVCNVGGEMYSDSFNPINLSRRSRNQSSAVVGLLVCPICGIGMAIGNAASKSDRENDIFGFAELNLKFKK